MFRVVARPTRLNLNWGVYSSKYGSHPQWGMTHYSIRRISDKDRKPLKDTTHVPTTELHRSDSTSIPANSPSLGRSLRHFRLAKMSVRGDGNLRHLSIDFFSFSGHHFVFSNYNPDEYVGYAKKKR